MDFGQAVLVLAIAQKATKIGVAFKIQAPKAQSDALSCFHASPERPYPQLLATQILQMRFQWRLVTFLLLFVSCSLVSSS